MWAGGPTPGGTSTRSTVLRPFVCALDVRTIMRTPKASIRSDVGFVLLHMDVGRRTHAGRYLDAQYRVETLRLRARRQDHHAHTKGIDPIGRRFRPPSYGCGPADPRRAVPRRAVPC